MYGKNWKCVNICIIEKNFLVEKEKDIHMKMTTLP